MRTFTQRTTKSDEWATPSKLFADIAAEFGPFNTDPCATAENAKAPRWYDRDADGLVQPWYGRVFINPPFSQIEAWVKRAFEEGQRGLSVVMLIPARTGTGWWHRWVQDKAKVRFLRGRIRYEGAPFNAPFDSCLAIYPNPDWVINTNKGEFQINQAANFAAGADPQLDGSLDELLGNG